jgi:pimeloyl-ACP methyl ester carboxylesterase
MSSLRSVRTPTLKVVHSYVDVMPRLTEAGHRVIVPYLRGHGSTRADADGNFPATDGTASAHRFNAVV